MAYRKDYFHRDRRPPPPYSKHKQSDNGAGPSSTCGANDSKLPTELFQDMCKKIANLTKVVCNLTNKLEDQDFSITQMKKNHEKELQHVESESKETIQGYKAKIATLEARLLEEKRQRDQKEEEFQILRRICNFTETIHPFKNSTKATIREWSPSNRDSISEDKELCETKYPRPVSACLAIDATKPTVPNGFSDVNFISQKCAENRHEEIKILLDICEKLRDEKRELQVKYDLETNKNNQKLKEDQLNDLQTAVGSQTAAINELKTKLEKQELQYRKRINELLQHLSQSENRAEKHVKHIKQLELLTSAKEKQVSAVKGELSRTVELLKQSKEASNHIREISLQQSEKIAEQSVEIKRLEEQSSHYSTQLLESNLTIKELQNKISKFSEPLENFPPHPDTQTHNERIDGCECEQAQLGDDRTLDKEKNKIGEENLDPTTKPFHHKELTNSFQYLQEREKALVEELRKARQQCEKQVEDERIVHAEIQDNLEQQIDLLHANFRQVLSTESEELDSLRNSLEEKTSLLVKAHKELAEATSFSAYLASKLRQKDEDFSKTAENIKQTQKLNLVEKLQGAMAKCLPSKETFISSLEAKHLINKTQKLQDGKEDTLDQEKDIKAEYLDRRMQVLEASNLSLLKNQNMMKQAHQAELNAQTEAHKKHLSKFVHSNQVSCKDDKETLKRQHENKLVSTKDERGCFQRKFEGSKFDGHKKNIDIMQKRLLEMQTRVSRKEEDVKAKQMQAAYLASLVEKLKQENNCLLLSQVEKIHAVKLQASQQIRNLENYWQERMTKELKTALQTFEKEKQKLTSQYSKDQRLLKDKISLLQSTIFATSVKLDKEKPLSTFEFKKLHDVIGSKESQIQKLQEEKESLLTELAARRGRSSSFQSTHMLVKSSEMTLCLKKPRLERPPLTPQLVRRHSLAGNSENKWFRARSQSPLNGVLPERSPLKPTFSETSNHRASWTGDSISDLLNCAMTVSNEVEKMAEDSLHTDVCDENIQQQGSVNYQPESSVPEMHPENMPLEDKNNSPIVYACDTIVECDEIHSIVEEKCNSPNEKLSNITKKLLK